MINGGGQRMGTTDDHCEELVADCRLRAAADLFAHTWDPVVIAALRPGPQRRHELRAAIGGISDKVLTETLRRLVGNGLIARHARAETPPRVDYALTRLGQSLADGAMSALGRWITDYGDELLDAQEHSANT
jgi:DNA-binding HxlR family transcriptional regulator